jgi:hypothetical protein
MGIRLACPNGHKLHVKSFLAGKRGVCPKCGATFVIPSTSDQDTVDSEIPTTAAPRPTVAPVPASPVVAGAPPDVLDDAAIVAAPPPAGIESVAMGRVSRYSLGRRRVRRSQVVLTIWLLVVVIVLAGLLVWVLSRGAGQAAASLQEPPHLAENRQPPYVAEASDSLFWEASLRPMVG